MSTTPLPVYQVLGTTSNTGPLLCTFINLKQSTPETPVYTLLLSANTSSLFFLFYVIKDHRYLVLLLLYYTWYIRVASTGTRGKNEERRHKQCEYVPSSDISAYETFERRQNGCLFFAWAVAVVRSFQRRSFMGIALLCSARRTYLVS